MTRIVYFFSDTKSKYSRQMGVSKFLDQQCQHGKPALESDNILQNAGATDTLQVFSGFQEKISHGIRYIYDELFLDKWQ